MQVEGQGPPIASTSGTPLSSASTPVLGPGRARGAASNAGAGAGAGAGPSRPAPRLKLKIADSAIEEAHFASRQYDRDVDSDRDEPLHVEEQFILRLPENAPMNKKIAELVATRELGTRKGAAKFEGEPWFKFRDARRAIFGFGKPDDLKRSEAYQARLVDLPCIIESHKTLDQGKHMFKSGDIVQMLLVEGDPLKPGQDLAEKDKEQTLNIENFVYDHGLTPPLQHVRKRRFRRRANRRTIEAVERMVEKLLAKDQGCEKVEYELIDPAEEEPPNAGASESLGAPTPGRSDLDENHTSEDEYDAQLAAELEKGLGEDESDTSRDEAEDAGSDSDMGGLFGSAGGTDDEGLVPEADDGEEETPEKAEARRRARLLADEVRDLESTIKRKMADASKIANQIMRGRAEDTVRKLNSELELKRGQLDSAMNAPVDEGENDREGEREGEGEGDGDREGDGDNEGEGEADDVEDDDDDELFGGAHVDDEDDLMAPPPPSALESQDTLQM